MNIRPNPQSNIFFLYIDKEKSHIKRDAKKATQGIQYLYTHCQKGQKRKKIPSWPSKQPQLEPNQSIKLTIVRGQSTINNLASDQIERTKEYLSLWIDNTSSLMATLFLAFQTVQKMQRGATLHTFQRFLPTKEPCQLRRVSLTEEGSTHDTPNKEKSKSHKTLVVR